MHECYQQTRLLEAVTQRWWWLKEQWINIHLIYRSSKTCPLSFSVCALIPTTFMAWSKQKHICFHNINDMHHLWIVAAVSYCSYQWHHLGSHVHFCEAEGLEVVAWSSDRWSNGFHKQLLEVLANKGPHLLQHLDRPATTWLSAAFIS